MRLAVVLSVSVICGSLFLFAQDKALESRREPDCPAANSESQLDPSAQPLPEDVIKRLNYETPDEDELLFQLEKDYIELLKVSRHPRHLLEAEDFLRSVNNNSTWTNYSKALKLLRQHRDKAAIPLLLRYIVLHAERSSHHIYIPAYAGAISFISGHKIENPYVAGPETEKRMRVKVADIVDKWWSVQKDTLTTELALMNDDELNVLLDGLLEQSRDTGRFHGSGGGQGTAYRAYHLVFYGVMSPSSDEQLKSPVLDPRLMPLLLQRYGYRANSAEIREQKTGRFPYEAIPILAALRKNELADDLETIAADTKQNSTVRLLAILSLMDAGESLRTEEILSVLESETGTENRMIALLSLMNAGPDVVPVLLKHLQDPNIEIATAAACSLRETKPVEALPLIDKRIRDNTNGQSLIMLFGTLEEYHNEPGRKVLAGLVRDSLSGEISRDYLDRALDAFEEACNQDWDRLLGTPDAGDEVLARFALAWYQEHQAELQQKLERLAAQVENAKLQYELAARIVELRQAEYKRLLLLQADEIVGADVTQAAGQKLESARSDAKTRQTAIATFAAQLATLKSELGVD